MIASASNDTTVKLWKKDGTLLKSLDDHKGEVNAVSISPDGQMIASASDDKTVKLWRRDGRSGKTLSGYRGAVKAISFSPDSQTLALATDDKTVILWNLDLDLDLDQLVVYACDWVRDYLKNNSKVEKNNRTLCDDIPTQK
jgi:WD40 repeat protein